MTQTSYRAIAFVTGAALVLALAACNTQKVVDVKPKQAPPVENEIVTDAAPPPLPAGLSAWETTRCPSWPR